MEIVENYSFLYWNSGVLHEESSDKVSKVCISLISYGLGKVEDADVNIRYELLHTLGSVMIVKP